ncbi:MAG: homocysteine S-methyltransferase family protein [Proteocatella sp.]
MDIREYIKNNILVFDGAMGTRLQQKGLMPGDLPECLNLTHPDIILEIHKEYVAAGADVITTNTFQACELKLENSGYSVEEIVSSGIQLAKKSGARYVALDMGPTGQLLEPLGTLKFDQAYELFKRQVIAAAASGADLILIETMSDLYETKAAILAAKENSTLPVFATLTYQPDGRTFTGTDPITGTITLQSLGVDALGVNCSMSPDELIPIVDTILEYSKIPVIVQANAGLPEIKDETPVYSITPEVYARYISRMVENGAGIIGGCCGTTPEFIKQLRKIADSAAPFQRKIKAITAVTSSTKTVIFDGKITVIGERINPSGKKRLKEALRNNQMEYIISEAINQTDSGADILDINVGIPEIDEASVIAHVVRQVQSISALPVQIDSTDPLAIEAGVRASNGRPVINSVSGSAENMAKIFPIAKKYGAVVVGLTLDENGIPSSAKERVSVAKKIVDTAAMHGISKEDIIIDCLTLTASAQQASVMDALEALKIVKAELGVKTVLGVSNVSFGLPNRPLLNSIFLAAALGAGLDAPILDPLCDDMMRTIDTFRVFNSQDIDSAAYVAKYSDINLQPANPEIASSSFEDSKTLKDMIIQGRKLEAPRKVSSLVNHMPALEIINEHFIPALDTVGERFEKGEIFLPQLMQSAETVKACFEIIKNHEAENPNPDKTLNSKKNSSNGKIIVATVFGDIHDIGKNIAKMLLENYGYDVIDLGKDVPISEIISAAKDHDVSLIGLSALMTTTVKNIKTTISAIREAGLDCKIMVGGAVLNPEYAEFTGADFYVKDARESVEIARNVFQNLR